MRVDGPVNSGQAAGPQTAAGAGQDLAQLIAELAFAELVTVVVSDDGEITYALTSRGEQTALQMAMSRNPHALVLLGAFVGMTGTEPN